MARVNKKVKYAEYGIEYSAGKIYAPEFGWISPLLIDGNTKLGKGVWTWSTLPGNVYCTREINGKEYSVKGTCPCNCDGCYAQRGNYNFKDVKNANVRKTWLANTYSDWLERAIIAQIHADGIKLCRIHASGDFFSLEYIAMWQRIVKACSDCVFWTYTKNPAAESAFDGLANINIVKSIVPGFGFNFGHCDYIIRLYNALQAAGKPVYICRCGIDDNQHCTNCKGCSRNEYVLFVEHSTGYDAKSDPLYETLKAIIDSQPAA